MVHRSKIIFSRVFMSISITGGKGGLLNKT